MNKPKIKLDHVGWVTTDVELFEKFWCEVLGFKQIKESCLDPKISMKLFKNNAALIRRYNHPDWEVDIEIHWFDVRLKTSSLGLSFARPGINHICLHTGGAGSRQKFLETIPKDIKLHVYDNPKGWQNIFLQDYEDNWVELREDL